MKILLKKWKLLFLFSVVFLNCFFWGCRVSLQEDQIIKTPVVINEKALLSPTKEVEPIKIKQLSELEQIVIEAGLVRIKDYDSTIKINLKYATQDNFLKINLYGNFREGYLQEPVAKQLANAEKFLKDTFPDFSLIVFDAVRPLSIQKLMWDSIKVPADQKSRYLSNPGYGSLHNYGAAVDVSIVDSDGNELDMGTPYDSFEPLAYPVLESSFLKKGVLTKKQISNRQLLRSVMGKALFTGISTEWWHFNSCSNKQAKIFYSLIKQHSLKKKTKVHIENTDKANICFKVQIKVSSILLDSNSTEFKGLHVNSYFHKGIHKYVTGNFKDIASAYDMLDIVNDLGFTDAFVVAFNNKNRIEVKDAIQLMP